jgi:hypothetical protein
LAGSTAVAAAVLSLGAPGTASSRFATQVLDATSIRSEQQAVVEANHRQPMNAARSAVSQFGADVAGASAAVDHDQAAQAEAEATAAAAAARLGGDRAALDRAISDVAAAGLRLAGDRAQLRVIAIGMYTGALTNPQPASLQQLEAEQQQVIDSAEVGVVAQQVTAHVRSDLTTLTADTHRRDAAGIQVGTDRTTQASADADAQAAAARTRTDAARLAGYQQNLAQADRQLGAAEADLTAALDALTGPVPPAPGQLSLLGGAALDAGQMVSWYDFEGYVDLTSAPIDQLAAWYLQAGREEGIRGDVAFAQAVLETGGFSSPDAVNLNNYAGIGHCDTCSAGWPFPSPQGGVVGQVQLLRIFADAGPAPAGAPAPVRPELTPGREPSAGCCASVESLTGVWATDPTYGQQILGIYGSMLGFALSPPPG